MSLHEDPRGAAAAWFVVRRTVKWICLIVAGFACVMWIGSLFIHVAYFWPGRMLQLNLGKGAFSVAQHPDFALLGSGEKWLFLRSNSISQSWGMRVHASGRYDWQVLLPLWIPVLVFGATSYALWRWGAGLRNKGACTKCGYDRAGLDAGATCPECGATLSTRNDQRMQARG